MRTVGIATRQITNFDSAHETPVAPMTYNQEILRYWDRNTRGMIAEVGMIWNFHSWTDVYLNNRYSVDEFNGPGWQTIDGTPQEHSDGKYQLGPAPLSAVNAMRKMRFDTSFVMSEVSSRIHNYLVWCPYYFGRMSYLPNSCRIIQDMGFEPRVPTGTIVSTKTVGAFGEHRITALYHNRTYYMPSAYQPTYYRNYRTYAMDSDDTDATVEVDETSKSQDITTDTHEIAIYHYKDSGVSMSITMESIRLGEPLDIVVNFACKERTQDFDRVIRDASQPHRHHVLSMDSNTDTTGTDTAVCPDTT
uniref:Protein-glutamine gamma-glutamyltransferase 4 n=1 Tax=Lygus hesperus TaxID=30085 RepID=A0A0A9Y470_LYGHE